MNTQSIFFSFVPLISAYFLGAIPFGLVLARVFCGIDPRTSGSGNTGATNVARLCGKKWGFLTLVCDLVKGAASVLLAMAWVKYGYSAHYVIYGAGFAAIFGHMFPIFLGFKGGKGVATTVGVYLVLAPLIFLISAIICIFIIWRTGFVSAGSLALISLLPLFLFISGKTETGYLSLATGTLVFIAHRDNLLRLLRREEKAWTTKK